MIHKLKIDKVYLDAKLAGDKLFEIRYNDRGYQKGDIVEYQDPKLDEIPFRIAYHRYEITYVTPFQQKEMWVVFGEKKLK